MLTPIADPRLSPLLPFVHLAWSGVGLSSEEVVRVREYVREALDALGLPNPDPVLEWLQPDRPPGPEHLSRLRQSVSALINELSEDEFLSLTTIAHAIADRTGEPGEDWHGEEITRVLGSLQDTVGAVRREALRGLRSVDPAERRRRLFDAEGLARYLAHPNARLREEVLALLATAPLKIRPRPPMEEYRTQVLEAVSHLADRGYGRLAMPESVGGQDDRSAAATVFETLAFGDLSVMVKYGVQFGLFGGSVLELGTDRHHRRYLEDIASLALPGCFAMTEVAHGSNVRGITTTATYDAATDELVVDSPDAGATKDWIGNAACDGQLASVFAQLRVGEQEHGVHVVLVPIRNRAGMSAPGVTIADRGAKAGLLGVDNGRLSFAGVRVPRENLLDRYASISDEGQYSSPIASDGRRFFTMLGALVAGRVSIAAAAVSVSKTALTTAIRYSDRRVQFGPAGAPEVPILDYLLQQRSLLPRLAMTYGLHFAVRDLVARYSRADPGEVRQVEGLAAGLKAVASQHAMETIQASREACGGEGYSAANRFGELRGDADIFTTFEGANPVLLQLVAKALLGEYRDEMGDLSILDMVKYLAERGQTRVTEMNPVTVRNTDSDHLRDLSFHASALEYREERLLGSVARRLKSRLDAGMDSFQAMNACQDHMAELARAHVERVVQERFVAGVARAPSPGLSEVLGTLARLYGLSRIEAVRGWYLEAGYLEANKSRAIRGQVNQLCAEVRENAVFLVKGFGIPDSVLETPAGL